MLLGVAEGASEVVPEKALPFEFNLDYMNGGKKPCVLCIMLCIIFCTVPLM